MTRQAVAGLHIPQHGYVAAGDLTRALASAAIRRGATFDVGSVVAVEWRDVGARSHRRCGHRERRRDCRRRQLVSEPRRRQRLARGREADSRPAAAAAAAASAPAERVIWGDDCYLVSRQDGSVLAGATVEDVGFDERATSVRRAAAPARRAGADAGARRRRVRGGPRRAAADDARRVARSSALRRQCRTCSTPPATIETACCWRR